MKASRAGPLCLPRGLVSRRARRAPPPRTTPPRPSSFAPRRCPTAQLAAECLALEAQAQWALRFGGQHCDDITVAVAFLPDHAC